MTHIIVYKTINKITGAFYIGVHKTDNLNDSYLGSGVKLNDNIFKNVGENDILILCWGEIDARYSGA